MALHRGIQSAVFYYVSCAPCADAKYRKKRRREAELGRLDREALAAEMPDFYRQADPSSTNPHWATEIETGPVLSPRGKWKGYSGENRIGGVPQTSATQRSNGSNRPSSVDVSTQGGSRDGASDRRSEYQRYQRDDDELWGSSSTERLGFSRSWQAPGVAEPPRAYFRSTDTSDYSTIRNPQINDLHPATVTKINSPEEARWMFQPPPTADVMSGKTQYPRSRSDSGNSSRYSARSAVPLSRNLSHRLIERRLKNGEHASTPNMSHESSGATANDTKAQRQGPPVDERDFGDIEEHHPARPVQHHSDMARSSEGSSGTVLRYPPATAASFDERPPRKVTSRQQLSTIMSNSNTASDEDLHNPRSRRSALMTKDDSIRVLQELAPHSRIFKKQVISGDELVRASKKTARMPSQDAARERVPDIDPEILEAWDTGESALPDWILEHTKREVKERWSMDI
ncbi:hypothetical protein BDY17DRAFT_127269 [Neohortaea acidophila]|uniref:Uncharacterized protein n=1 Tax=Neohortaea acidophila TaxID=245834 RepID=A0A6A6PWK8_9PEZI|nr:uncharacterized protein BDY17DRAFT_127269 [Neohortaea acidophila]KAF2484385.1 hypothetical protein BDY17DRAFT_127269 [Neohortaea acidophila]